MIEKIISGGQTGVDQAALLIAKELGIPLGGWCPRGGLDENNNNILEKYNNMQQSKTSNPDERTKLNIDDSQGTLILVPMLPLPPKIKDGTLLTIKYAKEQKKPCLIIDLSKEQDLSSITKWIIENNIKVLNVAGPRESNSPGIHNLSCELLRKVFRCILLDNTLDASTLPRSSL